jgi:hypothetical protein
MVTGQGAEGTEALQQKILEQNVEIEQLKAKVQWLETLAQLERESSERPRAHLMDLWGIGQGLYGRSIEDIDAYIRAERDSWES